jgi:hypothetical protein
MGRDLLFQHYLVAFIDILGQRESLRKLASFPTSAQEKTNFIAHIKETYGKVKRIRTYFQDYFDASESYNPNVNLVAPKYRGQFLASQKFNVSFYGFSDSIVICVPLMGDDENCTAINGVYSTFVATSGIGLFALSDKIPIRGGLDIGIATEIEQREIYGPALEKAVHLEHIAGYPRFIIGNELLSYLTFVENQEYITPLGKIAKDKAHSCKEMIIRDNDGRYMLDFLGYKLKEMVGNPIERETVMTAFNFVKEEYDKYKQQDNNKLMSRYLSLLNYFHHRNEVWDLS